MLWGIRVIIPNKKLLLELHCDHPGICQMKNIGRSYMWWPGLDHSIEELVKTCPDCQAIGKAPPAASPTAIGTSDSGVPVTTN